DLNARNRVSTANIDFSSTERRTKQLIELDDVAYEIEGRTLFKKIRMMIKARDANRCGGPEWQRQDNVSPPFTRRDPAGTREDSRGRSIAHCIFRSESAARSEYHTPACSRAGQ